MAAEEKKPEESKLSLTVDSLPKEDKHGFLLWKRFKAPNLTESEYEAVTKFTNNQSTLFDLLAELEFENKSPLKKFLKVAGIMKIAVDEPEESADEEPALEDYNPDDEDTEETDLPKPGLNEMPNFEEKFPKQNEEANEKDDDLEVVRQLLEQSQKGLEQGKYYDVLLSEGYVNGEYKEGIEVSAHGHTPDQPQAALTLIYDYLRFDYTKEDFNQGIDLEKFPSTIESDLKFVTTIREHDLLLKDKQKVPKPAGKSE
jgi:hypothetical protein